MAHILIIEDDPQFRLMLKQMLTQAGHDVTAAADGNEGVARYAQRPADLVITDIMMPGKDGIDTIAELRRDFPTVKVLAISGGRRAVRPSFNLESAHLLGADATLAKPFERRDLLETVGRLLAG